MKPFKGTIQTGMPLYEMLRRTFLLMGHYFKGEWYTESQMDETIQKMITDHEWEITLGLQDGKANPCVRFAQPALKRWVDKVVLDESVVFSPVDVGRELYCAAAMAYKDRKFGSLEDEFGHWWLLAENYKYSPESFIDSVCVYVDATLFPDRYIVVIGEREEDIIHRYEVYDET